MPRDNVRMAGDDLPMSTRVPLVIILFLVLALCAAIDDSQTSNIGEQYINTCPTNQAWDGWNDRQKARWMRENAPFGLAPHMINSGCKAQ